ncbi:MAG: hypothetical protein HOA57_00620 [Candidatus Magasanikbacteria bacterium]|jgi:hypothetical protein|nr:hypothetical protein [Candidatus Magasanikbacteria bacterium]MBT4314676.1 hypothetical protein [Candidatus Magasanikbacteria bacterium]MBT4547096.1 hypothetical protein [Candidatus Magasanikbacteria bacterium]MBT6818877.1 hypothetical protein [Candidatus Magasanikbacteria bacterium]
MAESSFEIQPGVFPEKDRRVDIENLAETLSDVLGRDVVAVDLISISEQDGADDLVDVAEITKVLSGNKDFFFFSSGEGELVVYRVGDKIKYFDAHDCIVNNEDVSSLASLAKKMVGCGGNLKSFGTTVAKDEISRLLSVSKSGETVH